MHKIIDFAGELGVQLHPGQAEVLAEYFESERPNWLLLAGRRSGKSLLSDIIACYDACVPDYSGILRAEEERYIIIVSVRQENAMLHIRNINKLLRHSKSLRKLITAVKQDRIELSNGVTILSLPASARAGRGFTASTVIFDELAHFQDAGGNSSADSVFDAYNPVVATFGDNGRLIITTTPMSRQGIVYDLFDRSTSGELDDFHITKRPTRELNPKVSEKTINRAMLRDAESASVEYFAEFSDPTANYLNSEAIEAAIIPGGLPATKAAPGVQYYMSIDPATMHDRYAFVIAHRAGEQITLDYSQIIRPPVNPEAAEDLLRELIRRFRPVKIMCDTASTVQRLKPQILEMEYTPFSRPFKLKIYGALKETLNLGCLQLYNDPDLIDELKALQIRNGVDIAAPRSGRVTHDDLADCLALVVDAMGVPENSVSVIADPFAAWDYEDTTGLEYHEKHGYVRNWNHKPHPEGVTWQTCKHRNSGCYACEQELESLGIFTEEQRYAAEIRAQNSGKASPAEQAELQQFTDRLTKG